MSCVEPARRMCRVSALMIWGIGAVTLQAQNDVLSIDPFADLVDLNRLTHPLTGKTGQTGSYDRGGGNGDASFWYYLRGNERRAVSDVDGDDYARFQACFSGDGAEQPDPACILARMDGDDDVDAIDLSKFMGCLSGANVSGDARCAD